MSVSRSATLPVVPRIARALALFSLLATGVGFLGPMWWFFDLAANFRAQQVIALGVLGVICWLFAQPRVAVCCAVLGVLATTTVADLYVDTRAMAATSPVTTAPKQNPRRPNLLIAHINVQYDNRRFDEVVQWIEKTDPDVLAVSELALSWAAVLRSQHERYPYRVLAARGHPFGIGIYSKTPIIEHEMLDPTGQNTPSIRARLAYNGASFDIYATHPPPPMSARLFAHRNDQLAGLAEHINNNNSPSILLGDLNATPWSAGYLELTGRAPLSNCASGFGFAGTWPRAPALFRIPIDHCLHTPSVSILSHRVGASVGSDHRPLLVRIKI